MYVSRIGREPSIFQLLDAISIDTSHGPSALESAVFAGVAIARGQKRSDNDGCMRATRPTTGR